MYVVFAEELEGVPATRDNIVQSLEVAFARIVCRAGLAYAFEAEKEGWRLVLTDVERPERSPDPIHSYCIKPRDARYDLLSQAVDGRIRGHVAMTFDEFKAGREEKRSQLTANG